MMSRMMIAAASCVAVGASVDHVSMVQAKTQVNSSSIAKAALQVGDSPYPKSLVNAKCAQVDPIDIDLEKYTANTWFVQEQQVVAYQPEEELRCAIATYDLGTPVVQPIKKFGGEYSYKTLDVCNYRLNGYATKTEEGEPDKSACFCAVNYDEGKQGALKVGPVCPDAEDSLGYYHVVKVGGDYDWVIVVGGPLTVFNKETGLCTTARGYDASGLWLLSKEQNLPEFSVMEAKEWATLNGIDWSQMYKVRQGEGWCGNYIGAYVKKDGAINPKMR